MTPTTASRRAAKGAKYLDGKRPEWFKEIDKDKLRMASCTSCIMGQIGGHTPPGDVESYYSYDFSNYTRGLRVTGLAIADASMYGLELSERDYDHALKTWTPMEESWAMLQCAWMTEIDKRQPSHVS